MTAQKFSSENMHCAARSIGNVFMPIRNFASLGLAGDFEGVDFGMSANALLYLGHHFFALLGCELGIFRFTAETA
jgi:hypothetical protein